MKIYTKKGDSGGTELLGGVKISKADSALLTN
jgi:cob(I)alamin adenosyltransferase